MFEATASVVDLFKSGKIDAAAAMQLIAANAQEQVGSHGSGTLNKKRPRGDSPEKVSSDHDLSDTEPQPGDDKLKTQL